MILVKNDLTKDTAWSFIVDFEVQTQLPATLCCSSITEMEF
jgi:hypothetical protein